MARTTELDLARHREFVAAKDDGNIRMPIRPVRPGGWLDRKVTPAQSQTGMVLPFETREIEIVDEMGEMRIPCRVTQVGRDLFRLEDPPAGLYFVLAEDFADAPDALPCIGDIMRVEARQEGGHRFVEVVERGAHHSFETLITQGFANSPELHALIERLEAQGGRAERIAGGYLSLSAPPGSRRDPKEDYKRAIHRYRLRTRPTPGLGMSEHTG
ncbi:MAG: hypothetical protein AAFZ18_14395 [Myxococcota bacterium]